MSFKAKTGQNKHRSHTVSDAIKDVGKDDLVGININIAKTKREKFKAKAAIKGKKMQEIILKAIDDFIEK